MSGNNSRPRAVEEVDFIRPILKQIKLGRDPHEIQTAIAEQDVALTVEKLVEFGLVDHLSLIAALQKQARPGNYFLTDKGIRWLRTYDRWERFKYSISRWQLFWGVVFGIIINTISNLVWNSFFV